MKNHSMNVIYDNAQFTNAQKDYSLGNSHKHTNHYNSNENNQHKGQTNEESINELDIK